MVSSPADQAAEALERALAEPHPLDRARLIDEALRLHRWAVESRQRSHMSAYRICLLNSGGDLAEERTARFEHDDAAIDHVGMLDHPHAIDLWQEERHVVRFPALGSSGFPGSTCMAPARRG
jgi:hypothetical protein